MKFKFNLIVALTLISGPGFSLHSWADSPSALQIVRLIVAQDKKLQQRRQEYDYDLDTIKEQLDSKKAVVGTTHEHAVIHGDHRPDYNATLGKGKEENLTKKTANEQPFDLLKFLDHFTFTLEGQEIINGISCYRIAFTPKPNMPYHSRQEKVLSGISGRLWASVRDKSLIRNEGKLNGPVDVGWGLVTVEELDFSGETTQLPNGDWGPHQIQFRYRVTIPFFTFHERDTRVISNYRESGRAE